MLFVIDKSLADALKEPIGLSGDAINAVELIAHAYRMGNHLVFAERGTLAVLKECMSLSDPAQQIYTRMYNRFPQTGSYRKALSRRVEIVAGEGILEWYAAEECKIIRVSADYASNLSLVNETVFLAENQDDIQLYETIAKVYLVWSGLGRIHIRNEPRGGGGHTTAVEYQAIQNRKERLCLCISDSDRQTPGANMKDTAKALERIDDKDQPLCEFTPLPVRELENMIPTTIYREASQGDVNRMKAVSFLEQLEASEIADSRRYLDIKKGLKLGEILHVSDDSPFSKYWRQVLKIMISRIDGISETCWCSEPCTTENYKKDCKCKCTIAKSFGGKILDAVIENVVTKKSPDDIAEMVCESLKPEWEKFGELITAWCCGSSRLSVI